MPDAGGAVIARLRQASVLAVGMLAAACSPLLMFNAVMPRDSGVRLALRDIAYGPDRRQRLDVYVPAHAGPGPLPVIVFFYGGSWSSGVKNGYGFVGRALATRGFVVVIPDYRLVPQVRFPAFLEDGASAVRWVRGHAAALGGDPGRLVLAGHSAGAYNAAMLALDPRWLGGDRAAVRGFAGLAGPYDFLPLSGPVVEAAFAAAPDPALTQPVRFAGPDSPPAFLATAGKDTVVRPENAASLARRLRAAGVAVERRDYPAVGHAGLVTAFAQPFRTRARVLDDLAEFAGRVTR